MLINQYCLLDIIQLSQLICFKSMINELFVAIECDLEMHMGLY